MNRRSWLTSLLALPLIPLGLRAAKVGGIPIPRKGDPFPHGGIELIVHDQSSTGYSFSCVSKDTITISVDENVCKACQS